MPRVIIISFQEDPHLKFVTKHLEKDDYVVIDPADIIRGKSLSYHFEKGTLRVLYKGVVLDNIKGVWYRRPTSHRKLDIPVEEDMQEYTRSSIFAHTQSFNYLFPDALWISDAAVIRRAASKPLQLRIAGALEFNVPETLFTSDPKAAERFVRKYQVCIAKPQSSEMPDTKFNMAKLISIKDDISYKGLRYDPYIFQQFIEPSVELRVTVVGSKMFAATVKGLETDGKESYFRDWRYAHVNNTFSCELYDLSPDLAKKCIRLVKKLGLVYGALDFIVDKRGKTWFLEINPNGQWAFIEQVTGHPIGIEIANLLLAGKE